MALNFVSFNHLNHQTTDTMLELIAIALLQLSSLTTDVAPVTNDAASDTTPIVTTPPAESGHGGWGGGMI
ncbi:hypothetical protein [Hymenobacter persicinus]|uniref:Uncharacterized protein n=1 Tax=Hymenobacter persicinus TaxID=2025506 RepID=A0A4Q5LBE2_9BACT|nr:hypothetical protein [Hymenobacter persicinus]RYU76422.1 hypothetical protein EWM57_18595 [Hymenobacter persicinus]